METNGNIKGIFVQHPAHTQKIQLQNISLIYYQIIKISNIHERS